ncbi:hypothetical protein PV797_10145 [Clostridiaceae bacterium M8S5]|nr:hypothetical protein PV797_10145 [Clostridiaceae bacterium M8S5]
MKKKIPELLLVLCVSYSIVSLINATLCLINGRESISALNEIRILVWCCVAIGTLYSHNLLSRFSPLTTMVLQYVIAISIIMTSIYIEGKISGVNLEGYIEGFVSFTLLYVIGGAIYYIHVFSEAKRDNKLLQEIRKKS